MVAAKCLLDFHIFFLLNKQAFLYSHIVRSSFFRRTRNFTNVFEIDRSFCFYLNVTFITKRNSLVLSAIAKFVNVRNVSPKVVLVDKLIYEIDYRQRWINVSFHWFLINSSSSFSKLFVNAVPTHPDKKYFRLQLTISRSALCICVELMKRLRNCVVKYSTLWEVDWYISHYTLLDKNPIYLSRDKHLMHIMSWK